MSNLAQTTTTSSNIFRPLFGAFAEKFTRLRTVSADRRILAGLTPAGLIDAGFADPVIRYRDELPDSADHPCWSTCSGTKSLMARTRPSNLGHPDLWCGASHLDQVPALDGEPI